MDKTSKSHTCISHEPVDGPEALVLYVLVGGEAEPEVAVLGGDDGRELLAAVAPLQVGVAVRPVPHLQEVVVALL